MGSRKEYMLLETSHIKQYDRLDIAQDENAKITCTTVSNIFADNPVSTFFNAARRGVENARGKINGSRTFNVINAAIHTKINKNKVILRIYDIADSGDLLILSTEWSAKIGTPFVSIYTGNLDQLKQDFGENLCNLTFNTDTRDNKKINRIFNESLYVKYFDNCKVTSNSLEQFADSEESEGGSAYKKTTEKHKHKVIYKLKNRKYVRHAKSYMPLTEYKKLFG